MKLRLPGGEIDFIGTGWLTMDPFAPRDVLGRTANIETPAEIIGKKIHHRAATFKARDLFDLATVLDRDAASLHHIAPVIRQHRAALIERIKKNRGVLQEEYDALDILDTRYTLDECIEALHRSLGVG